MTYPQNNGREIPARKLAANLQYGPVMENKLLALKNAIARAAAVETSRTPINTRIGSDEWARSRFVRLWTARNRRTRVLMARKGSI